MKFSPLYELRRGKWANISYLTMGIGMMVVSILLFCHQIGLSGIASVVTLVLGLFFGSLSGWAKSSVGSSRLFHYWIWGLILVLDAWRPFCEVFIPWATHAPH